jgi:TIR domain
MRIDRPRRCLTIKFSLMDVRPFISYAREDRPAAMQIHAELVRLGATPWMDIVDLVGGQEWQIEISRALKTSSHFIALLSHHSVTKRGYVQKEVRQALDILDQFPPGKIYVVPVRLDATEPAHESLRKLHWIDVFAGYDDAIRQLARSLGLDRPAARHRHPLTPMLSDKAMLILSEAAKTATGLISRRTENQTLVVTVEDHSFAADVGNVRGREELETALHELEDERLIDDLMPPKRRMFRLTPRGLRFSQGQFASNAGEAGADRAKRKAAEEITTASKEGVMVGEVQTIVFTADQIYPNPP